MKDKETQEYVADDAFIERISRIRRQLKQVGCMSSVDAGLVAAAIAPDVWAATHPEFRFAQALDEVPKTWPGIKVEPGDVISVTRGGLPEHLDGFIEPPTAVDLVDGHPWPDSPRGNPVPPSDKGGNDT